jgi:RNA polymerase sigma-70 factor (ECF subfamily)
LCARYREPARRFLRAMGCEREEAEDLAQDFLMRLTRPEALARLTPERGRLRAWMRTTLKHLLLNTRRDAAAAKRGNGVPALSLEDWDAPIENTAGIEAGYDREWAHALLRGVLAELRESYAARGLAALFDALSPALTDHEELQPYAQIGVSLGMKDVQVKIAAHRLRRRFAETLRAAVAQTVTNAAEIDDELRHLLRAAAQEPRNA